MILSYKLKKEQLQERLNLKSAEQAFSHQIVNGTNCSSFESEIIVEKLSSVNYKFPPVLPHSSMLP